VLATGDNDVGASDDLDLRPAAGSPCSGPFKNQVPGDQNPAKAKNCSL